MPELPEVETVCRGLAQAMTGRKLTLVTVNRPDLRFPFPDHFAERLAGRRIDNISRRAKYILVSLSGQQVLLMHLGMSGRFIIGRSGVNTRPGLFHHDRDPASQTDGIDPHDRHAHVIFALDDGTQIVYSDPRRFGFMDLFASSEQESHPRLRTLGIEPVGNRMNGQVLATLFAGRRVSLKAALLDQKLVAGIGNIYACEALFQAGLSPRRLAATVSLSGTKTGRRADRLAAAIREVLGRAIEAGGSSLRDFRDTEGEFGYFQHEFAVYGRTGGPCRKPGCGGTVQRIVQNNRSTFFCASCQR